MTEHQGQDNITDGACLTPPRTPCFGSEYSSDSDSEHCQSTGQCDNKCDSDSSGASTGSENVQPSTLHQTRTGSMRNRKMPDFYQDLSEFEDANDDVADDMDSTDAGLSGYEDDDGGSDVSSIRTSRNSDDSDQSCLESDFIDDGSEMDSASEDEETDEEYIQPIDTSESSDSDIDAECESDDLDLTIDSDNDE